MEEKGDCLSARSKGSKQFAIQGHAATLDVISSVPSRRGKSVSIAKRANKKITQAQTLASPERRPMTAENDVVL